MCCNWWWRSDLLYLWHLRTMQREQHKLRLPDIPHRLQQCLEDPFSGIGSFQSPTPLSQWLQRQSAKKIYIFKCISMTMFLNIRDVTDLNSLWKMLQPIEQWFACLNVRRLWPFFFFFFLRRRLWPLSCNQNRFINFFKFVNKILLRTNYTNNFNVIYSASLGV